MGVGILMFDELVEFAFGAVVGFEGGLEGTLVADFLLLFFLHFLYLLLLFLLLSGNDIADIFLPLFIFLDFLVFFVFGVLDELFEIHKDAAVGGHTLIPEMAEMEGAFGGGGDSVHYHILVNLLLVVVVFQR